MHIFKGLKEFVYKKKKSGLEKISPNVFKESFAGNAVLEETKLFKAYEKAWDARKFEIDNYWKRTTYFWAFQVTSFAAYFALINSPSYISIPPKNPKILYCVVGIGLITSFAWVLINVGSKFWQRHWEKYIDMLEDEVTGPLYKTIYAPKSKYTFSVSKINDIVSRFFCFIWIMLALKYLIDTYKNIGYFDIFISLGILYFIIAMFCGYGRGNLSSGNFEYYSRKNV